MAVSSSTQLVSGDFKRFFGVRVGDPCKGTFYKDGEVTGASGGGTASVNISWDATEFGFRPILVVTMAQIQAGTDPGNVKIDAIDAGTRHSETTSFAYDPVNVAGTFFSPEHVLPRMPIELAEPAESPLVFMRAVFTTNTDLTVYHLHIGGVVYDVEELAAYGGYSKLVETL